MLLISKGGERREGTAEVVEGRRWGKGRRGVRQKGKKKKKEKRKKERKKSNCYCGWEPGFSSTARSPLNPNVTFSSQAR